MLPGEVRRNIFSFFCPFGNLFNIYFFIEGTLVQFLVHRLVSLASLLRPPKMTIQHFHVRATGAAFLDVVARFMQRHALLSMEIGDSNCWRSITASITM